MFPPQIEAGARRALQLRNLLNEICQALADHDRREIRIRAAHDRHDRCVTDPEDLHAVHAQALIDYGHVVRRWSHLTGADTVVVTIVGLARELTPVFLGTWLNKRAIKFFDLRLVNQFVDELHRLDHRLQIFGMLEHARIDIQLIVRISAMQKDSAAIALLEQVRRNRHHALQTRYFRRRPHVDVKIRRLADRISPNDQTEARHDPIYLGLLWSFVSHKNHGMVLIVLADAVQLVHDGNSMLLELRRWSDAGQHEDLRRAVDAGSKKDLSAQRRMHLSVFLIIHAFGLLAGELQRMHRRLIDDREILAPARPVQIGDYR